MPLNGFAASLCEGSDLVSVKSVAAAEGGEHRFQLLLRAIPLREGLVDLAEPYSEQCIDSEVRLMTQQMEFHQQLICRASIQRRDDVRESCVKSFLAVSDRLGPSQTLVRLSSSQDHSAAVAAVRIQQLRS